MTVAWHQTLLCTCTRSICSPKTPVVGGNLLLLPDVCKKMLSDVRDTCDRNTFWEVRYKLTQPSNLSFTSCVRSSSSPSFIQALTMFLSSCWNLNVLPTFENRPTLSDSAPNVWNTSNSVALSLHSSLQIGYTIFIHDPMAIDVCLQSLS